MSKTYLLEEAKELIKSDKIQILNDCHEKIEMIHGITSKEYRGQWSYYSEYGFHDTHRTDLEIIPLSAIEDVRWGDEVQGKYNHQDFWHTKKYVFCSKNPNGEDYVVVGEKGESSRFDEIRKPVPNFSALIQSAQEAADEIAKGYVVKIEEL